MGVGPGCGEAAASLFARRGFPTALVSRSGDAPNAFAQTLRRTGASIHAYPCNVTDERLVIPMMRQCESDATNRGAGGIADGDRSFNAVTVEALKAQDVRNLLVCNCAEPLGSTPEQIKRNFASEMAKSAKSVRASKATAE